MPRNHYPHTSHSHASEHNVLWRKTSFCLPLFPPFLFISTKSQLGRAVWGKGALGLIWFSLSEPHALRGNHPDIIPHSLFLAVQDGALKGHLKDKPSLLVTVELGIWLYLTLSDFLGGHYLFWEYRRKGFFAFKNKEVCCFKPRVCAQSLSNIHYGSEYTCRFPSQLICLISHLCNSYLQTPELLFNCFVPHFCHLYNGDNKETCLNKL